MEWNRKQRKSQGNIRIEIEKMEWNEMKWNKMENEEKI
jgi:hypothetical protein